MTDRTRLLLLASGEIGRRCAALLDDAPGFEVTTRELDSSLSDLRDHQMVALVTERPFPAVAAALDESCWSARIPWLHSQLCAHRFRIGPIVVPPMTPCWGCLNRRLRSLAVDLPAHLALEAEAETEPSKPWFTGELSALTDQVAALTAVQCLTLRSGRYTPSPDALGHYLEGDAIFGVLRQRRFARIGLCQRCAPQRMQDDSYKRVAQHFGPRFASRKTES